MTPETAQHHPAGQGDQVPHDRRGRGRPARTGPVEHQLPGGLGLDEDGVIGLADRSQRVLLGHQSGVYAGVDSFGTVLSLEALADGQQLDRLVRLLRAQRSR